MFKKPVIALHLGVHKTATTYVQSRLWNSREELSRKGVGYIGLNELRKVLTSKLGNPLFGANDIFDALYPYLNCNRLIISDENILGGTKAPDSHKIYSRAHRRVKKLLKGLDGFEVQTFITIRGYQDYLISRYSESLRHFPYETYEEYSRNIKLENISWLVLLQDLHEAGCKDITVHDFKSIFSNDDAYLKCLSGTSISFAEASEGNHVRRSKISLESYEALAAFARLYSKEATKRVMGAMDNNPQETPVTPFVPFTKEQQKYLEEKYESHLKKIDEDMRMKLVRAR